MVFLISFAIVSLIVFAGGTWIRKHETACFAICVILGIASMAMFFGGYEESVPHALSVPADVLVKGGLSGSVFLYVMFAGASPDGTLLVKKVMPIRRQLSIMGCILALGHGLPYGTRYFARLVFSAADMRLSALAASISSLILLIILVPLFVTSFYRVRRKMKAGRWKRLQRLAYAFYLLMFLHIIFFRMQGAREGKKDALLTIVIYLSFLFAYILMRLTKMMIKAGKMNLVMPVQIICMAGLAATVALICSTGKSGEGVSRTANEFAGENAEDTCESSRDPDNEEIRDPDEGDTGASYWNDGTYKGAAIGYNGRLKVQVTVEDGRMSDIKLKSHVEDEPYVTRAVKGIFSQMLSSNSTDVDVVSSATTTSEALIEAVRKALSDAGEQ